MEQKILNLELRYRNKFLDTAKYLRDFKKKFVIGSDKNLLWQILDDSFPKRHTLITKGRKNSFLLHITKDMDIYLKRRGKEYTKQDLIRAKLLRNNVVAIDENAEGYITFHNDWKINFSFRKPYVHVLTPEEKKLYAMYARWEPLTKEQKFTRVFLILAILITLIGLYIFDKTYTPPEQVNFIQKLEKIEEQATKVIPEIEEEKPEKKKTGYTGGQKFGSEEQAKEQVEKAQQQASDFVKKNLGLELGGSSTQGEGTLDKNAIYSVNVIDPMFAATSGNGTKGGIGGVPSDNASDNVFNVGGSGDLLGSGEGSLASSLGDIGNIGDIANLTSLGAGAEGFEKISDKQLAGDLKNFKVVQIKNAQQFEYIKQATFGNVKPIAEDDIKLVKSKELKTEIANIQQQINLYKPQLVDLFNREVFKRDMWGTIKFNLLIEKSGKIVAVKYSVIKGSFFTPEFLEKARKIIMQWKIDVKDNTNYEFKITFIKQ